jgi:DNA (cytosine-5)-methyltransferase 1
MNHLDLCSGIGGFALAARWMRWATVGFAEIDPFASKVLAKHWPGVPNYGDIRSVSDGIAADLITAGIPCQPYSCAGKQLGAEDDRALWPVALGVITRVRPDWIVVENVNGFINLALDGVLADLEAEGYEVGTLVLPACAVNAPHRRDRVWILADASSEGPLSATHARIHREQESAGPRHEEHERRGEDVSHADREPLGRLAESRRQRGGGQPKSRVGWNFDGLPAELDRPFGSGPEQWDGDWERGIPRVAKGVKDRASRLKALGNAIVPQVAYQIFRALSVSSNQGISPCR